VDGLSARGVSSVVDATATSVASGAFSVHGLMVQYQGPDWTCRGLRFEASGLCSLQKRLMRVIFKDNADEGVGELSAF